MNEIYRGGEMVEIRNKTNNNKRIIKFRAWIKDLNKMYNVEGFNIEYENIVILLENGFDTPYCSINYYDCELMQYTGLKDRNDKEIYEGDIVKMHLGPKLMPIAENDLICVIEYGLQGYGSKIGFSGYYKNGARVPLPYKDRLEVIGNIYENPELMED